MEINSLKLRVSVKFGGAIETLIIDSDMTEKCLIQESLRALEMNEDSWQDYVLIIEETNSRARSSQNLRDNDKLYLNKRISIDLSSCNFKKKNNFDWESSIQDKNLLSIQENSCID